MACWVVWGFLFDDDRCDRGERARDPATFARLAGRAQRALEIGHPAAAFDDLYIHALHDLGRRLRRHTTPVLFSRLLGRHLAWLSAVTWQIGNQARGELPGVADYLALRTHSAGGGPTLALVQIARHLDNLPDDVYDAPAVQALTDMAQLIASLDNDRHSLRRELEPDATDQNIVTVLAAAQRCTLDDALYEAVRLRDRIMLRFLHVRERILPAAPPGLRNYLLDLSQSIRGNNDWGVATTRYQSAPSDVLFTEHALDPDPAPPGITTIDGWWNPEMESLLC